MDIDQFNSQFIEYLQNSPTPFHAVRNSVKILKNYGFTELSEADEWQLSDSGAYFIVRENAALIAFVFGSDEKLVDGFRIFSGHTDSPGLQMKPKAGVKSGNLQQLGVEVYGGNLLAPWFDRDLSIAGRVSCELANGELGVLFIDFKRPLLFIPSVAIHFDREANNSRSINSQQDLPPVIAQIVSDQLTDFVEVIGGQCRKEYPELEINSVLGYDLFCYDSAKPIITGINNEFISAGRLDNLASCFAGLIAIGCNDKKRNSMLLLANHEEIGSTSATGAQGSFLTDIWRRIMQTEEQRQRGVRNSFFVSMDNAHATHPNKRDKSDLNHEIFLNGGPVIKYNASQRYTTFSVSSAVYKKICQRAAVPYQEFVMRSDLPCGSTIGPVTSARLGVRSIDIGIPSLAMHSIREHTGVQDTYLLFRSIWEFCASDIHQQIRSY